MKKWLLGTTALALVVLGGVADGRVGAADKTPTIAEIMEKVNKRKGGLHSDLGEAIKAGTIDWADAQKKTKEYATLAEFLGKNDPPKGPKASWEKLTKAYAENAKKLDDAAKKKDKASLSTVHATITKSCGACHKEHKED